MPYQLANEEPSRPENTTVVSSTVLKWEDLPVSSEMLSCGETEIEEIMHEDTDDDLYDEARWDDVQIEEDRLSEASELHIHYADEDSYDGSNVSDEDFEDDSSGVPMDILDSLSSAQTVWSFVTYTFVLLMCIAEDAHE